MQSNTKKLLLLGIFIGLTLIGILVLNLYPSNVIRTTHQVQTPDGVISFNLYQPKGLTEDTPVVVMGHGVIVNKEMMTNFAIELASAGLIVANLDWSGHGQSTAPWGNLSADLEAVIATINDLTDHANMSALALLGYSMGGFGTYPYAVNNSNVKAWVGVGTMADGDISNTTNPRNVLLIIGSLDEGFSPEQTKAAMVNLTGLPSVDDIEFDRLYGNISNGTARKVHFVLGADHLITPWHREFVITATEWILSSFGMEKARGPSPYDVRNIFAWVGFFGLMGLTFISAELLADKFNVRKDSNLTDDVAVDPKAFENHSILSFIGKYYIITFLLLPTILIFSPLLFFTPLAFTAALTLVVGCYAINIFIYSWRLTKRWNLSLKSIFKKSISQKANVWIYSIILTILFFLCYYLTIGRNYLGIIPATTRIPYLILYCGLLFFIIFFSSIFVQKLALPYFEAKLHIKNPIINYLTISLIIFLLVDSWFVILIMVPCIIIGNYFFAMILILMVPIFLFMIYFGIYIEKRTGSTIPGTLLNAIMIGFLIVTLSPYGDVLAFFSSFF